MTHSDIVRGLLERRRLLTAAVAMAAVPVLGRAQGTASPQSLGGKEITVDGARTSPIPIAIPPLAGGGGGTDSLGRDMAGVITNNLQRSGLFRPIDPNAFIGGDATADTPNFQNWKAIGAQALMSGKVESQGGDRVRVEFRLWDVLPGTQIQGTAYSTTLGNWRRIAHIISDVIYERLLGEKGYFDTRVVYVAGSGPRDRRVKRLAIMDQDSANNRFLSDGSWNALTPRFSPDGGSIVMAQTRGGGSDIYVVSSGGGGGRAITNSGAIDVSPCYSPDGAQIVFNSDRGGDQQIYVMGSGGGGVKRISFGRGQYATPVWSPRGDFIAFTRFGGGTFAIGVMHPDGSGERILSESYFVEGPTFAPNGRVIMFCRETAARDSRGAGYSARLVSIDIAGFNERPVSTPTDGSDADWSPLLA